MVNFLQSHHLSAEVLCILVGNLKLGIIEVEIRRIDRIVKGEPWGGYGADGDEGVAMDFIMIDGLDQPPWLVFRFDICLKEPLAVPASTAKHIRKRMPSRALRASSIGDCLVATITFDHTHLRAR